MEAIKQRGERILVIGPKTYKLKANFAAFVRIENSLQIGILLAVERFRKVDIRHTDLATIIFHLAFEGADVGSKIDMNEIGTEIVKSGMKETGRIIAEVMACLSDALTAGSSEAGTTNPN